MNRNTVKYIGTGILLVFFAACREAPKQETEETVVATQTPVTVAEVSTGPMTDSFELNAVSAFLLKSYVKANANGYLQLVNTTAGAPVTRGQLLFSLKTKEAQSIGNSINALDSNFRFSGINQITASTSGYITQLNHQQGDYVQDGEQLAVISDVNSFVFLLDLPYELRPAVLGKKNVDLLLPDEQKLTGTISSGMPTLDAASQTQPVVIKVITNHPVPENLVARVHIVKQSLTAAQSLPKAAVLANETQDQFWVMKMIDSTTAVKVEIKKGIENKDRVQILSPVFSRGDRILVTGNYGLSDTAKVKVTEESHE